jgi:LPS-assembly lipoprotein
VNWIFADHRAMSKNQLFNHRWQKMVNRLLITVIVIVLLSTAGCGFQLRGSESLDFTFIHLKQENAGNVALQLEQRLTERGVHTVPVPQIAQVVLYLRNAKLDRRVLTVSAISGKMEEVELNLLVNIEARKSDDDTILLKPQRLTLTRDYIFDETAVLAMGVEEETLREEMFRDLVTQIVRRLETIQLQQLAVSQLAFENLQSSYKTGERFILQVVETEQQRSEPVDLWIIFSQGGHFWFISQPATEIEIKETKEAKTVWQLTQEPQPWLTQIPVIQTHHQILDFIVSAEAIGDYTLIAFYTQAGTELDLTKNLVSQLRSNIAQKAVHLKKKSQFELFNLFQ